MANYRDSHIFVAGGNSAYIPDDGSDLSGSNEAESDGANEESNADYDEA